MLFNQGQRSSAAQLAATDMAYVRLSTIDEGQGDGKGACNGGIYIVRRQLDGIICVEKRLLSKDCVGYAIPREIDIHRRLRHPNIVPYLDGVVSVQVPARMYLEFFSHGTLREVIYRAMDAADAERQRHLHDNKAAATGADVGGGGAGAGAGAGAVCGSQMQNDRWRGGGGGGCRYYRKDYDGPTPATALPEEFLWHVFMSLVQALVYLRTGSTDPYDIRPVPGWVPILHRDIKPANVFLRPASVATASTSRSSKVQQPVVALGDFGLAEPVYTTYIDGMRHQYSATPPLKNIVGTPLWQPPELPLHEANGRGDVWAVGAVMHALCRLDMGPVSLDDAPPGVAPKRWICDPDARRPRRAGPRYSPELNMALAAALTLDVQLRPDACALWELLLQLHGEAMKVC
jgi:serine/threonine protein kinase